jgi:hypothetical protein
MDKENELEDGILSVEVDEDVIGKVITGEITQIYLDITDANYQQILENKDGNLVLVADELLRPIMDAIITIMVSSHTSSRNRWMSCCSQTERTTAFRKSYVSVSSQALVSASKEKISPVSKTPTATAASGRYSLKWCLCLQSLDIT